jgi:predicted nucleic acid-binding protein
MALSENELIGVDTPFMIAHTIVEQPEHPATVDYCNQLISEKRLLALCPTVIDEFLHVVTDPKRFEHPLSMKKAVYIAETWMRSQETVVLLPTDDSNRLHLRWMVEHRLERKRINDTRIASIYHSQNVRILLTSNARDYSILKAFKILNFN